jgi:hypothetical protein
MWYVSSPLVTRSVNFSIAASDGFRVGEGLAVALGRSAADGDGALEDERGDGRHAAAIDAATTEAATKDARSRVPRDMSRNVAGMSIPVRRADGPATDRTIEPPRSRQGTSPDPSPRGILAG